MPQSNGEDNDSHEPTGAPAGVDPDVTVALAQYEFPMLAVFGKYQLLPDTVSIDAGPKTLKTDADIDPSDSNVTVADAEKS
jgi:hypothetical protein